MTWSIENQTKSQVDFILGQIPKHVFDDNFQVIFDNKELSEAVVKELDSRNIIATIEHKIRYGYPAQYVTVRWFNPTLVKNKKLS